MFRCLRLCALWAACALCGWGTTDAMAQRSVTIGAEDDWPPYSFRDGGGNVKGITPRLVAAVLKTQGIQVKYEVLPFSRCMHDAQEGRLVACFNATITQDNKTQFLWHPTPLFVEELGIFARGGLTERVLNDQDLVGHTVGITRGYTYPSEVVKNPRIKIVEASSDLQLMKLLQAGRLEYALLNTLPAFWRIQQEPALKGKLSRVGAVSQDRFWMAISRKHPQGQELHDAMEAGLRKLKASGEYERLMQQARQELLK